MGWRTRVARWLVRSTLANPEEWLVEWFHGSKASSGVAVNAKSAQQSSTVFACVQVRSQDIAKLPVPLYQRMANGSRRRATEHPLYRLMNGRPNQRQTSFEFREMMQAALDLRGNAYAKIVRDSRARPVELLPLADEWVTPMMSPDGTPFYDVRMYGRGKAERYSQTDILHLRDRSDDGFVGKSCISRARDVVGLDLAGSKFAAKMYANGARPGGILVPKSGTIGKPGRDLLKQEWEEEFGGVDKTNSLAVMGQEFDYKPLGMSNVDAEFIENRKLTRSEIAAIFRVPPHKVGNMENATFSNIEHQSLEYVTDTLMPIACRWEEALNCALLRESEQAEYYFEFMFDALLRGDFLSRMQGYAIQRLQIGRSYNDIAGPENWEKLPPEAGGDEHLVPLNMWPMGKPRPEKTIQEPPAAAKALEAVPGKVIPLISSERSAENA